jgi:hypothetical protein
MLIVALATKRMIDVSQPEAWGTITLGLSVAA